MKKYIAKALDSDLIEELQNLIERFEKALEVMKDDLHMQLIDCRNRAQFSLNTSVYEAIPPEDFYEMIKGTQFFDSTHCTVIPDPIAFTLIEKASNLIDEHEEIHDNF